MIQKRDYYKILNIAPIATEEEIKKAYRDLSKKYHPDLNPDLKLYSDEKMKELVEAYNILIDKDKRREYDGQPCFQLKKSRKSGANSLALASAFASKPQYKKEASLLERIFTPFQKEKTIQQFRIDPKQADVHFTLGLSMSENTAFYDQAIAEFGLAVKFLPEFVEAMYDMGIMNYRKGYYDEAIIAFQKVLSVAKNDANALKIIGLLREEY